MGNFIFTFPKESPAKFTRKKMIFFFPPLSQCWLHAAPNTGAQCYGGMESCIALLDRISWW